MLLKVKQFEKAPVSIDCRLQHLQPALNQNRTNEMCKTIIVCTPKSNSDSRTQKIRTENENLKNINASLKKENTYLIKEKAPSINRIEYKEIELFKRQIQIFKRYSSREGRLSADK